MIILKNRIQKISNLTNSKDNVYDFKNLFEKNLIKNNFLMNYLFIFIVRYHQNLKLFLKK